MAFVKHVLGLGGVQGGAELTIVGHDNVPELTYHYTERGIPKSLQAIANQWSILTINACVAVASLWVL